MQENLRVNRAGEFESWIIVVEWTDLHAAIYDYCCCKCMNRAGGFESWITVVEWTDCMLQYML